MEISELNPEGAYITLQLVDPLCLGDIDLVWQTSPAVQYPFVVHITDQLLTLLGQKEAQHIHRHVELGLPLLKVFLVLPLTLHFSYLHGPQHLGVVLQATESDVVPLLLAVSFFVLELQWQRWHHSNHGDKHVKVKYTSKISIYSPVPSDSHTHSAQNSIILTH